MEQSKMTSAQKKRQELDIQRSMLRVTLDDNKELKKIERQLEQTQQKIDKLDNDFNRKYQQLVKKLKELTDQRNEILNQSKKEEQDNE